VEQQPTRPPAPSPVQLRVPATEASLPLVRTVAAAVAAQLGLTIDAVEDIRLVASEIHNICIAAQPSGLVTFEFIEHDRGLRLRCHLPGDHRAPDPMSFSVLVIEELSASFQVAIDPQEMLLVAEAALAG
jgi:hypothetical protein